MLRKLSRAMKLLSGRSSSLSRVLASGVLCLLLAGMADAQNREQRVRQDRERIEKEGFWIYNDLPKAFAEARKTGQPLLVVLRCLPCTECVKLDDELIDQDPLVKPLLTKFVRVRVVSTNGLDLSLFQFDTDQSFAVFLLHADGGIYGRFGTRSHRTYWEDDVSIAGLARAMEGALELHAQYPTNKDLLAKKKGPAPTVPVPEKYPSLAGKYGSTLNYEGNVVQSCIHCHQIGDAEKERYLSQHAPLPPQILFPYPHPKTLGLILDPDQRARVREVLPDSPAAAAGFQPGDDLLQLAGQPLLSIADVQWVLHQADAGQVTIPGKVRRQGQTREVSLSLAPGWRQKDDLSWRSSTWQLRRRALGGMFLESLSDSDAREQKFERQGLSLFVRHVGQYSPHDVAKRAGFQKGDIVVSVDGRKDLPRETDVLIYLLTEKKSGDKVPLEIWRNGELKTLPLEIPK